MNEILGARLNTLHNLHYYLTLAAELRAAIAAGTSTPGRRSFTPTAPAATARRRRS